MRDMNERPVCHRAEDLVTYLYGEAAESDARDFRNHLLACEACKSEFTVFNQVHESIELWRNEALGSSLKSAVTFQPANEPTPFGRSPKLSAMAALREFFQVAPLWLRAATAFAAVLLCALAILTVVRTTRRPVQMAKVNPDLKYSQEQLDAAVKQAEINRPITSAGGEKRVAVEPQEVQPNVQVANNRNQPKKARPRGLTLQERQQLAADLRLLPGADEEELPFGISDQPNQ